MKFSEENLDYKNSPYTGMSRKSWEEAGAFILSGIFKHIRSIDEPVIVPRQETDITYPHDENNQQELAAERFEGLARSLFIAAPLIHNNPNLCIENLNLREYYKKQILRSCTKGDPLCVGIYEDLLKGAGEDDPFHIFQQTVESAALVICLWMSKEEIWDTYNQKEKDRIATFIKGYAYGNTVPNNWHLFNMLDLAFLHMEGYLIDKDIMREHAQTISDFYAGDGWYRDGHAFDYYSCWAFNLYTPIWNLWYGYEQEPALAKKFEDRGNTFIKTFPAIFDRDSFVNMWGRSSIYRNAVTSAFFGNLLLKNSECNPGLARKISSGALRQFLDREDTLHDGIPTLGFYGQFTPLVQGYSCAESPLWLGKAFMCLYLPETHPFWQAKEENGGWEELKSNKVNVTTLDGPALSCSNHCKSGETILRTGKVIRNKDVYADLWNYAKLSFNTKYPWEAAPDNFLESQQYVLENLFYKHYERGNCIAWCQEKQGVLYRRQYFDFASPTEFTWLNRLELADFTVPCGLIRVDKSHFLRRPFALTLGAYGFPDNGTQITELKDKGASAMILKGYDSTGVEKQLAMTIYDGWDELSVYHSEGTNPDSLKSIIIYARATRKEPGEGVPTIFISQVITKESHEDFTYDEIFPIKDVEYGDPKDTSGDSEIIITLKDKTVRNIGYDFLEGSIHL